MRKYKNTSRFPKMFYGVKFEPGSENEVPGWINDPAMILVNDKDSAFTSLEGSGRRTGRKRSRKIDVVDQVEEVQEVNEEDEQEPEEQSDPDTKSEQSEDSDETITEDAPF